MRTAPAPYPVWNVARKDAATNWPELATEADGWYLHECDIPTRPTWHWRPNSDAQLASVERLMKAYDNSIGVGANILINMTPDSEGRLSLAEVKRIAEFGDAVRQQFGSPIAQTTSRSGWTQPGVLQLDLPRPGSGLRIVVEEDIAFGQHVLQYAIESQVGGEWKTVGQGTSIGRKRIHRLEPAVTIEKLRLRIVKADAVPIVRCFATYGN